MRFAISSLALLPRRVADVRADSFPGQGQYFSSAIITDTSSGLVFGATHMSMSFSGFPSAVVALNPDGSHRWLHVKPNGGRPEIAQGPDGDIFIFEGDIKRRDRLTGGLVCSGVLAHQVGSSIGSADGAFFTYVLLPNGYNTLHAVGSNCVPTPVYSPSGVVLNAMGADQGRVFITENPSFFGEGTGQLVAIAASGGVIWRNTQCWRRKIEGDQKWCALCHGG